jgi:hypothetical protein
LRNRNALAVPGPMPKPVLPHGAAFCELPPRRNRVDRGACSPLRLPGVLQLSGDNGAVRASTFSVLGSCSRFGSGFEVPGLRFGSGFEVPGSRFRVRGSGFEVPGSRFGGSRFGGSRFGLEVRVRGSFGRALGNRTANGERRTVNGERRTVNREFRTVELRTVNRTRTRTRNSEPNREHEPRTENREVRTAELVWPLAPRMQYR